MGREIDEKLFVRATADECVAMMGNPATDRDLFERALRTYVYDRFHLDCTQPLDDDFDTLADASIEILLGEKAAGKAVDAPSLTCDGATSADTKRVLLIVVLQKKLGVKVDPDVSADLVTVPALSQELFRLVCAG